MYSLVICILHGYADITISKHNNANQMFLLKVVKLDILLQLYIQIINYHIIQNICLLLNIIIILFKIKHKQKIKRI